MICKNCGCMIRDDSKFCSICGNKVEKPEAVEPVEEFFEGLPEGWLEEELAQQAAREPISDDWFTPANAEPSVPVRPTAPVDQDGFNQTVLAVGGDWRNSIPGPMDWDEDRTVWGGSPEKPATPQNWNNASAAVVDPQAVQEVKSWGNDRRDVPPVVPVPVQPANNACPRCGAPMAPGAKFCTICGFRVAEGGPVPVMAPPVQRPVEKPVKPPKPAKSGKGKEKVLIIVAAIALTVILAVTAALLLLGGGGGESGAEARAHDMIGSFLFDGDLDQLMDWSVEFADEDLEESQRSAYESMQDMLEMGGFVLTASEVTSGETYEDGDDEFDQQVYYLKRVYGFDDEVEAFYLYEITVEYNCTESKNCESVVPVWVAEIDGDYYIVSFDLDDVFDKMDMESIPAGTLPMDTTMPVEDMGY